MKMTLESTTQVVWVGGMQMRVWEGMTARGQPVSALVARVACPADADLAEFKRDLEERRPPAMVAVWPARMVRTEGLA